MSTKNQMEPREKCISQTESKCTHYSPEELEILDFIENETPKSVPDLVNELAQLKASVKTKVSK